MIWSLLSWLSQHPLVALLLFVSVGTWIITQVVVRRMLAGEQAKEDAQRKRLDRVMQASHPPAAPGFNRKRVG